MATTFKSPSDIAGTLVIGDQRVHGVKADTGYSTGFLFTFDGLRSSRYFSCTEATFEPDAEPLPTALFTVIRASNTSAMTREYVLRDTDSWMCLTGFIRGSIVEGHEILDNIAKGDTWEVLAAPVEGAS